MARLALHGPMYSGKSTLGHALEQDYGYTFADFTGYLKILAARALSQPGGAWHSREMIEQNKGNYRTFLQEFGRLINFDSGKPYVEQVLGDACFAGWLDHRAVTHATDQDVVFDNVRTLEQWEELQRFGFTLVRLSITPELQAERAFAKGLTLGELERMRAHPCEQPLPQQAQELILPADHPVDELAKFLVAFTQSTQSTEGTEDGRRRAAALTEPAA